MDKNFISYHDRALGDIRVASLLLTPQGNPTNDEGINDIAAYHVQQAFEKEFKYLLHDICGISDETRDFKTHIIDDIIDMVESQTSYIVPDNIKEIALTLTNWESKTRYPNSIISNKKDIENAISVFDELTNSINDWKLLQESKPDDNN